MKKFKKSFPDWYVSKSGVQSTALLHLVVIYSYYFRMAECAEDVFVNPDLSEKLKEMWNKEEFSDTLFLVNDCQFHVSSHWVSVMSGVLKGVISDHYQHCGDREIQINEVKNNESFSVVLKFIYGFGINLKEMDKELLCDVLYQAERFQLNGFSKKLKSYLSSLDKFDIDSFAVLINTAKNFAIDDLYKKLVIFAYENADQLVKHESFVDLKYDVLSEMLKADNFFAAEIDILLGALKWHENNFDKKNYDEALKVENDHEFIGVTNMSHVSKTLEEPNVHDKTDQNNILADEKRSNEKGEEEEKEKLDDLSSADSVLKENNILTVSDELNEQVLKRNSEINAYENCNTGEASVNAVEKVNEEEEKLNVAGPVLKEHKNSSDELNLPNEGLLNQLNKFSENILKSLLSHIRIRQVSFLDFQIASNLDSAKKYKQFLEKCELFSQTFDPRIKYAPSNLMNSQSENTIAVSSPSVHNALLSLKMPSNLNIHCEILHDLTRRFTVTCTDSGLQYSSEQEYVIAGLTWKLLVVDKRTYSSSSPYQSVLYLQCSHKRGGVWTCAIECQIRMLPINVKLLPKYPVRTLPDSSRFSSFINVTFSESISENVLGTFYHDTAPTTGWRNNYAPNYQFTFEVHFEYIHKTVKEIK